MYDHSITGLVESCKSLSKLYITLNISPYASVSACMHQQNLISLLSNMTCNISCTIHMYPYCTQAKQLIKLIKYPTNFTSKQDMQKLTKKGYIPTSFTHIVIQIIKNIQLTDVTLHQQFIYSMVLSYNCVPRNSLKHQEAVQIQKQEQCTQEYQIKIGP